MTKNIIFDMGNVLIRWRPVDLIANLGFSGEDARLLLREVYQDQEWAGLDRGRLTESEAHASICRRLPEHLHDAALECIYWWHQEPMPGVPGMAELVGELKGLGYGLYLCSNATSALHTYFPRIPGSEHFDGLLVSADHKLLKHQPEIYELLYRTFDLDPAECLFIDDSSYNIDGGIMTGMPGIVFDGDLKRLRHDLRAAGIPVKP